MHRKTMYAVRQARHPSIYDWLPSFSASAYRLFSVRTVSSNCCLSIWRTHRETTTRGQKPRDGAWRRVTCTAAACVCFVPLLGDSERKPVPLAADSPHRCPPPRSFHVQINEGLSCAGAAVHQGRAGPPSQAGNTPWSD